MNTTIGEHYPDSDRCRITPVEYNNTQYEVYECLWEHDDRSDEWQVTLTLPNGGEAATDSENLYEHYRKQCDKIRVLAGLEYELTTLDTDVSFWTKEA